MSPIHPNVLAAQNREVLRFVASMPATESSKTRSAKATRAFKVTKKAVRKSNGDEAAKKFKMRYHHELAILHGEQVPTYDESLNLLISLIFHLDDTAGYSNDELLAIAPFLVMLTQVHGKGNFYVLTDMEVENFLNRLTDQGWNVATFPVAIPALHTISAPPSTRIPYGTCTYDLPESENSLAKKQREEKAARSKGNKYNHEPFQQTAQSRKEGATVYIHLTIRQIFPTFPTFEIKDAVNMQVSKKHVTPFKEDDSMIVEVVLKHDEEEHERALVHNHKVITRACRYIIWSMRNPEAATPRHIFPPVTFESLDMYNPVYQHATLAQFGQKLTEVMNGNVADGNFDQTSLRAQDLETMRTFMDTY